MYLQRLEERVRALEARVSRVEVGVDEAVQLAQDASDEVRLLR